MIKLLWKKYSYTIILCGLTMFFGMTCLVLFSGNEDTNRKEIVINDGDSLWTIAEDYADGQDMSVPQFISWVQKENGLKSYVINAGDTIVIPAKKINPASDSIQIKEIAMDGNN
ncbi:cell division suppressor protein YneA [Falsibacillus pallidus]|uniref:cell division suppressor protein YneA n=1 Tax=Falsibacillus pallidus TaxID=493781 RepID=UPI003D97B689